MTASKDFLLRFVQQHPTFRQAELESCAALDDVAVPTPLQFVEYDDSTPFAIVRLDSEKSAARLIQRSILAQYACRLWFLKLYRSVFELWGCGDSYEDLSEDILLRTQGFRVRNLAAYELMERANTKSLHSALELIHSTTAGAQRSRKP
jgi:hypothetical protein